MDECTTDTDNCTQNCENTDGSFTCSCNDGYTTTDNGITCDGIILPIFEICFEVITNLLNAILLLIYYSRFCSVFDSLAWLDTCGYKNYVNEYIEFFRCGWM